MTKILRNSSIPSCGSRHGQKSHASPFDGRGRGHVAHRRVHGRVGNPDRDGFRRRWSLLMIASFATRESCAVHFGKTFQTACNWFDGTSTATGEVVNFAMLTLPRYAEIMQAE